MRLLDTCGIDGDAVWVGKIGVRPFLGLSTADIGQRFDLAVGFIRVCKKQRRIDVSHPSQLSQTLLHFVGYERTDKVPLEGISVNIVDIGSLFGTSPVERDQNILLGQTATKEKHNHQSFHRLRLTPGKRSDPRNSSFFLHQLQLPFLGLFLPNIES